jgi:hypothetical protein
MNVFVLCCVSRAGKTLCYTINYCFATTGTPCSPEAMLHACLHAPFMADWTRTNVYVCTCMGACVKKTWRSYVYSWFSKHCKVRSNMKQMRSKKKTLLRFLQRDNNLHHFQIETHHNLPTRPPCLRQKRCKFLPICGNRADGICCADAGFSWHSLCCFSGNYLSFVLVHAVRTWKRFLY